MIEKITNLSRKRSYGGAVIFFLLYVILGIILGSLIQSLISPLITYPVSSTNQDLANYLVDLKVIFTISFIYVHLLYVSICIKKKLKSPLYIVLGIVSILLCIFLGWVYSMIIVAFLTTREAKLNTESSDLIEEYQENID